jgi:chemotaxis protein CheZ
MPLDKTERLALAAQYLEQLEKDQEDEAHATLQTLKQQDDDLYQAVGKLAREVHDSIKEVNLFTSDPRLNEITEHELPDAKERLSYVVTMTDQAANTTLGEVENSSSLLESIQSDVEALATDWQKFRQRELQVEDFRQLCRRLDQFFDDSRTRSGQLNTSLNEILMAQSYQDLTGQILRRVSTLVQDVESKLVELLRIAGGLVVEDENEEAKEAIAVEPVVDDCGPVVPGVNEAGHVSGQDEVDDLLSELGF